MNVYFDNAATTPLRNEVIKTISRVMEECFGNPSSNHSFGRTAKTYIETARKGIADLLNALPQEIIFTSGGTESIIMAVRAYKEMHKNKFKRDCKDCVFMELPNIIMSETAHASFSKACDLMDIEVKMVGIDYNTRKMNLNEVESAIDKNTILIVASAPAFSA